MAWDMEEWARRVMEADTEAEADPGDSQPPDSAKLLPGRSGRSWVFFKDSTKHGTVNTAIPVEMICYLKWRRVNTESWELMIVTVDGQEHRQFYDSEDLLLRVVVNVALAR